jgi:hypothetical protein
VSLGYTFEERVCVFWSKVDRSAGQDACWTWTGAVTSKWHYGCFQTGDGRVLGAHKVAWLLTNGDTDGLCVLHRCDNRVCVNPAHLFLGTKQDNWDDMDSKGRYIGRGATSVHAKLTEEQARYIKATYRKTGPRRGNGSELARQFGVTPTVVHAIGRGDTWKHLK